MSTTSTPNDSPNPAPILPMHNPSQAAHVVVPQGALGNAMNGTAVAPGMGMKALLAKKMAKTNNPKFVSPTDNMLTPVTQKLNAAKQKRFARGAKPTGSLFATKEKDDSDEQQSDSDAEPSQSTSAAAVATHDDANPFD